MQKASLPSSNIYLFLIFNTKGGKASSYILNNHEDNIGKCKINFVIFFQKFILKYYFS